jgi:hypothetical protein
VQNKPNIGIKTENVKYVNERGAPSGGANYYNNAQMSANYNSNPHEKRRPGDDTHKQMNYSNRYNFNYI